MNNAHTFKPGDHVVYMMQKQTYKPGPRAEMIYPSRWGEGYSYCVRKLWTVVSVLNPDTIAVITSGGKMHTLRKNDPLLHKAGFWEGMWLRVRWKKAFPSLPVNDQ